jgi:hypothetical protein
VTDLAVFAAYQEAPADESALAAVDVPAELILQVATGLEDPADVARRFGFEGDRWASLAAWPPFQEQVAQKRLELQRTGVTFRMKCAFMAEDLITDVYRTAKQNDTTLLQKLETTKTLAKLADLEPKQDKQTQQGTGFQININIPPMPTKGVTIDNAP